MFKPKVYFLYTHNNVHERFKNGLKANTEISYWCAKALSEHFPNFKFLRSENEKKWRLPFVTSKDVVIGHPGSTLYSLLKKTKKIIIFAPWSGHEDRSCENKTNCFLLEEEKQYYDVARSIILLTSEFNKKKYLDHRSNFWFDYFNQLKGRGCRIQAVHQPIDFSIFPRIKWTYDTNNFLYVGNRNHMKCVEASEALVSAVGRQLHLFGTGEKTLNNLDASAVNQLPKLADFFIQPGMWEAQCVGILEAAARGFIPLVSAETGYPYDHPYLLRYGDMAYNAHQINKILATSAQYRRELADHLHTQFINDPLHNNWKCLTDVLVDEVSRLLRSN
jgi:hypothetical protein